MNESFGNHLTNLLTGRGMTQCELAERSKTSQPVISAICNGKRKCGLKVAVKLADAFGLKGQNRENFLSYSNRPKWKGCNHEVYGNEALLYHILETRLKETGVQSTDIKSITHITETSKIIFVMNDGEVYQMDLSFNKINP